MPHAATSAPSYRPPLKGGARRAVRAALARGAVMTYPTETFYALGGNALNAGLVRAVFRLKGRLPEKSLLLLVDGLAGVAQCARETSPAAQALMQRFWPGPLTLVLPAARALPAHLRDARDTVALRWSSHPVVAELLRLGGVPLVGTSANPSGAPAPRTVAEMRRGIAEPGVLAIDGGETAGGMPSTVLDATTRPFRIVRPGAVSAADLRTALAGRFPEAAPEAQPE